MLQAGPCPRNACTIQFEAFSFGRALPLPTLKNGELVAKAWGRPFGTHQKFPLPSNKIKLFNYKRAHRETVHLHKKSASEPKGGVERA